MHERPQPPLSEKFKPLWIPLRDKHDTAGEVVRYDQVSWIPSQIPYGQSLALDVTGMNRWLHYLGIDFPVHVANFSQNSDGNHNFQINSITNEGAATISSARSTPLLPSLSSFAENSQGGGIPALQVNFSGIADYVNANQAPGSEAKFNKPYASLVNKALLREARPLVQFNLDHLSWDNKYILDSERFQLVLAPLLTFLINTAGIIQGESLVHLFPPDIPLYISIPAEFLIKSEFIYVFGKLLSTQINLMISPLDIHPSTQYLTSGSLLERLEKTILPKYVIKYLLNPALTMAFWSRPLISPLNPNTPPI